MNSESTIDSHVHVWTSDVKAYPLAAGNSTSQMQPRSFTPDDFLSTAGPFGVCRAVLIQMDFYGYDNSYLLDTLRRFPETFVGVAQICEHGTDPSRQMSRLRSLGIRGVRIMPSKQGNSHSFESSEMRLIWKCAAIEKIAICPLVEAADLAVLDRLCKQFPETMVVVDHMANIGGTGQFSESDIQMLCRLSQHKNVYVKISAFYFFGRKRPPYDDILPMIRRLLDSFGPQRLMWGSDSPFQLKPPNTLHDSLEFVRCRLSFVSAGDMEWILHRSAAGVFFA